MDRRTVRRGFAALAIAAILGVGGAHPAAAEEIGFFEQGLRWLSGLWGAQDTGSEGGLFSIWAEDSDKGPGMDPNGGTPQTVTRPPDDEEQQ